jgi:hypothetical protein
MKLRNLCHPWTALRGAWRRFTGAEFIECVQRETVAICALSFEEARTAAYAILNDKQCYRLLPSGPDEMESQLLLLFPPGLRELMEKYARIEPLRTDIAYIRAEMGPSEYRPGFLRIAMTHSATELVVHPEQEPVNEIDGSEGSEMVLESMPSEFHRIIFDETSMSERRNRVGRLPHTAFSIVSGILRFCRGRSLSGRGLCLPGREGDCPVRAAN